MANSKTSKRAPRTWCSEKLFSLLQQGGVDEFLDDGANYLRRRRLLDFLVAPGSVSARVQDEDSHPYKVEMRFPTLSDEQWDGAYGKLSEQAFFLASLLAGDLPQEVEQAFSAAGCKFLPDSLDEITFHCDANDNEHLCKHLAALYCKLRDRLDSDPFTVFNLLGRGREETLSELRRRRRPEKKGDEHRPVLTQRLSDYQDAPALNELTGSFWSAGAQLNELSYQIRADELPAAILKWLDQLPIGELCDDVEPSLEEAYARITSRAQAYGIGIKKS